VLSSEPHDTFCGCTCILVGRWQRMMIDRTNVSYARNPGSTCVRWDHACKDAKVKKLEGQWWKSIEHDGQIVQNILYWDIIPDALCLHKDLPVFGWVHEPSLVVLTTFRSLMYSNFETQCLSHSQVILGSPGAPRSTAGVSSRQGSVLVNLDKGTSLVGAVRKPIRKKPLALECL